MEETKKYNLIYMIASNIDDKAIDEFMNKFENEVKERNGIIESTKKERYQMVRTTINKGARNGCMVTSKIIINPLKVEELTKYLRLAQGVVVNLIITKIEEAKLAA